MSGSFALCVLISAMIGLSSGDGSTEVKTPYGTYKGHLIKSRGGRDLLAFKGIRYAQPPVGKLRFKEPVELEKGEEIFEANKESICMQRTMKFFPNSPDTKYHGTEDCLHLNIYRPKDHSAQKLPVYFWIHGGGYMGGSGSESYSGPAYLLDGNRDFIFVSSNYRLSILGFLSANDDNLPGNLGLKDQTMALKWIKENIEHFGGDPESITIGGLSAGGSSVSQHLNSKASKGLFQRAISQSGTADCPWATKPVKEAREIASKLISSLNCSFEPVELMECLQNLPAETLMDSVDTLKVENAPMIMHLTPVVEKDSPTAFMTEDSIKEGSDVPWLSGVTNEEGLIFYQIWGMEIPGYLDLSILKNNYETLLPVLGYYGPKEGDKAITKEIVDFYFGKEGFSKDTVINFVRFLSDRMFNHGLHVSASKYKGKFYSYVLSYKGNLTLFKYRPEALKERVGHGDDLFYFFDTKLGIDTELKGNDLKMSNNLIDMWYNFIIKGNPTPDSNLWEESDGGKKSLNITNDGTVMTNDMFEERMKFFDEISKKYHI